MSLVLDGQTAFQKDKLGIQSTFGLQREFNTAEADQTCSLILHYYPS